MPPEVPQRVKDLALQLTASSLTPYDRVRAIESYLRTIPYTLDVPLPPANRDVVDYFLFDLREGYCDYYATAMVVLARAAGVPARLAMGYAPGTYNLNSKRFVVTEADAHSWVEVYFPDIGWVPFEPTPARPELLRTEAVPMEPQQNPPLIGETSIRYGPWNRVGLALLLGLAFLIVLAAAWTAYDEIRLQRLPARMAAAEVYRRMKHQAASLGLSAGPGDTPYEFSVSLSGWLGDLMKRGSVASDQPVVEDVQGLTREIVRISYQPSPPGKTLLLRTWRRLHLRLALIWISKTRRSIATSIQAGWNGRFRPARLED